MSASKVHSRGFGLLNSLLLVGSAALLVWGGVYVGKYGGRFDGGEFSELPHGRPAKVVAVAADPLAAQKKAGLAAYNVSCLGCHQEDGNGNPALNIPPLAGADWVLADGPNRLIRIVAHGLKGPVTVNGTVWNGPSVPTPNTMNPWLKTADNPSGLSEQAIADVLTYVRNSWGNKAGAVTLEQVKSVLDAEKGRDPTEQWTAAELEAVPVSGGAPATGGELTPDQLKEALKKLPAEQLKSLLQEVQPN